MIEVNCVKLVVLKDLESYKRDKYVKIMNVYFNGILLRIVFYF